VARKLILLSLFVFLLPRNVCFGHGVQYHEFEGGIGIEAIYDDGIPMSYSEVKIFSPADGETEFQSGLTDKNGRFVFCPDIKGRWKIVVDDGMGHHLEVVVTVNEARELKTHQQTGNSAGRSLSQWERATVGICIIFGISGIFFWWKGKRMYRKNE
jgi:nickel transport protein